MINRILFTGQILKFGSTDVIRWFSNLFAYYAQTVTNLPVQTVVSAQANINKRVSSFDVNMFYKFYGVKDFYSLDKNNQHEFWAKIYYNKEFNKQAYEYVYNIFKNSLVIVHETEHVILNILDYYGISYIDLNTDPIRYLDDQMFAFRSNNEDIYSQILKYQANEELFYLYANYIKTCLADNSFADKEDAVLFLGQTKYDRSVVDTKANRFYRILDHKEEFEHSLKGYNKILYKPHPYGDDSTDFIDYIKSFKNIEITTENFYKLLCSDYIKKVVSISSGGCIEAKYFNKDSHVLLKPSIPLQREKCVSKDLYVSVYNDFFNLSFWSDILSPVTGTKKFDSTIAFSDYRNKLRNSRGYKFYWGYEDIEQEMIKQDIRNELIPRIKKSVLLSKLDI